MSRPIAILHDPAPSLITVELAGRYHVWIRTCDGHGRRSNCRRRHLDSFERNRNSLSNAYAHGGQ